MCINIKYFYQEAEEDYEAHYKILQENASRLVFLNLSLPSAERYKCMSRDIRKHKNKDILYVRFPNLKLLLRMRMLKNILSGKGIELYNGVWLPTEIWIYCPYSN
jgi:hypothetical protein